MNNNADIFLVDTPFQYLCANEARQAYQTQYPVLICVEGTEKLSRMQFDNLLDPTVWNEIIKTPKRGKAIHIPRLIRKLRSKHSRGNAFFYSKIRDRRARSIMRNLDFKKYIYFDDGTMTIVDYIDYIQHKYSSHNPHKYIKSNLLRLLSRKILGCPTLPEPFEMFSIFDFPEACFSVKKNNLSQIQRHYWTGYNIQNIGSPAGFIGMGMVAKRGRLGLGKYLSIIESYKRITKSSKLIYFPHPLESTKVSKEVELLGGINFHYSKFPIEIELPHKKIHLSSLGGIGSTSLYTLKILLSSITSSLPIYNATAHNVKGLEKINTYYRSMGFIEF